LKETNERQWATAEVLQVINLSQGNLAPVFDAILEKAWGLCGAAFVNLWTYDDERQHATALRGVPQAHAEFLTQAPLPVGPVNAHVRLLRVSYDFDLDTAGVIIAPAAERRLPKLREAHHLVNAQLL
jgi:hypothetical protein